MSISATVLALALFGGQPAQARAITVDSGASRTCLAPERTGTFRVLAMSKKGNEPSAAILILENIQGCLEVTFVIGGTGPTVINSVTVDGNTLQGSLRLSTGTAKVSFKFSDKEVTGTIVEGRREWKLDGHRTS